MILLACADVTAGTAESGRAIRAPTGCARRTPDARDACGAAKINPRKPAMRTIDELGWDGAGEATTLAAAAADAGEWLALIERLHDNGRGPWKFSDPESAGKLRGCRASLHKFIDAERAKDQPAKGDEQ